MTTKTYSVYILGSLSGTLYIGVTRNLHRRVFQHKFAPLRMTNLRRRFPGHRLQLANVIDIVSSGRFDQRPEHHFSPFWVNYVFR